MISIKIVRGGSVPRLPDCFQTRPKRVVNLDPVNLLGLTVDGQGVHCVLKQVKIYGCHSQPQTRQTPDTSNPRQT